MASNSDTRWMMATRRLGASRRAFVKAATLATILWAVRGSAQAQSRYPTRPVRIIVPFAAGGGTNIIARLAAQRLGKRLGGQFYVENIPGAGGNIGTSQAARAASDGHTILFVFGSFTVNPSLFAKAGYDPLRDFEPVTLAVTTPTVLIVHPSVPANTAPELAQLIAANPGKHTVASGGIGTQGHLAGEQFRLALALDLVHVPFNGAGPLNAAVVAGHAPIAFSSLAASASHIRDGRVRVLAITSKTRSPLLPDVPTMVEVGLPEIVGTSWVGVLLPAGAPKDIVIILHHEIVEFIAQPETKEHLQTLGYEPVASTPDEFAQIIKSELEAWPRVIHAANIRVQ